MSARAEYFDRLAHAYVLAGDYLLARRANTSAIRLYQKDRDLTGLGLAFLRTGDIERQLENPKVAYDSYQAAEKLLPPENQLDARMGMALSLRSLGKFKEAREQLKNLCRKYTQLKDTVGEAHAFWALATTDRFLGRLKDAEQEARKSLTLYRRLNDRGGSAFAWAALGGILRMKGRAQESGACYRAAWTVFHDLGDKFGLAYASCGIGNSHRMQKKYKSAMGWSRRAEKLYRHLKMEGPLSYVLWALAQSEIALHRRKPAERHLQEAARLFQKVGDQRGLVYIDLGWGEYHRAFFPQRAQRFYTAAAKRSARLHLRLEEIESQSRKSSQKKFYAALRQIGVDWPHFQTYQTFP